MIGLAVLLGMCGLVAAQDKDKGKGKEKDPPRVKAKLVKVDVKKSTLTVEIGGKTQDVVVGKDVKIVGPRGGATNLKDKRLQPGIVLGLQYDGKVLKAVHIPVIRKVDDKGKDKGKEKDKGKDKDKDKDKK
jgi:hypothetical protein